MYYIVVNEVDILTKDIEILRRHSLFTYLIIGLPRHTGIWP
jgi:hypothetical protein